MKPIPKVTFDIIKRFEGRKLVAYKCPSNVWTVGYGETGPDIVQGVTWTIWQCEERLKDAVAKRAEAVDHLVKVELTSNQRAALISFVYNIGIDAFKNSTLLRLLNQGKYIDAAGQFPVWNKSNGRILSGLVDRRDAEMELFLKKD